MKSIILSRGLEGIIDDEDFLKVSKYKWHAKECGGKFYVARTFRKNKRNNVLYLHRELMMPEKDMKIDHIDGNPLNNQKSNLRICTHSQNLQNCNHRFKNKKSIFKGLGWHDLYKAWRVRIRLDKKELNVGYYKSEKEAALAYNVAASFAFGQFARLNKI